MMRDFTYIPDITERFPEGFNGVDMLAPRDIEYEMWDAMERDYQESKPFTFSIGDTVRQVGIYGGVTYYTVKKIERDKGRIKFSERWEDVDGTGTRPAKWHKLITEDNGNEKALDWTSETFGDIYILACNAYR